MCDKDCSNSPEHLQVTMRIPVTIMQGYQLYYYYQKYCSLVLLSDQIIGSGKLSGKILDLG